MANPEQIFAMANYCRAVYENEEADEIAEALRRCLELGGDPRRLSADERLLFMALIEKATMIEGDDADDDDS